MGQRAAVPHRRDNHRLNFSLEEIDGEPRTVVKGTSRDEETLLQYFLHPAPHFVPDVLYEISLVERLAVESSRISIAGAPLYAAANCIYSPAAGPTLVSLKYPRHPCP